MGLGTSCDSCLDLVKVQVLHDVLFVFFCMVRVADHRGALDV